MNALELTTTYPDNTYDYKLCLWKNAKKEGYSLEAEWSRQRFSEDPKYKVDSPAFCLRTVALHVQRSL